MCLVFCHEPMSIDLCGGPRCAFSHSMFSFRVGSDRCNKSFYVECLIGSLSRPIITGLPLSSKFWKGRSWHKWVKGFLDLMIEWIMLLFLFSMCFHLCGNQVSLYHYLSISPWTQISELKLKSQLWCTRLELYNTITYFFHPLYYKRYIFSQQISPIYSKDFIATANSLKYTRKLS